jgi:hypothetical protein
MDHSNLSIGENRGMSLGELEIDSMRDIRYDLRERLASISGRYADELSKYDEKREALERLHRETIAALERERMAIEQLLAIEEERQGIPPTSAEARKTARLVPLADFLITKVYTHGPIEKDQLREEVNLAGYFAEGNGRTFHTTLMNVTKCRRLIRLPDGRYACPHRDSVALFGVGAENDGAGFMQAAGATEAAGEAGDQ